MAGRTTLPLFVVAIALIGCTGSAGRPPSSADQPTPPGQPPAAIPPGAKEKYDRALREMAARDAAGSWSNAACAASAKLFIEAAEESGLAVPRYNAGLAYARCGNVAAAKAQLAEAAARDPRLTRARVELALMTLEERGAAGLDAAIAELKRISVVSRFSDPAALTGLAMLELRRGGTTPDNDGANDLERAKKNIHRALAIDDGFMPAYNQLALYYLEAANRADGAAPKGGAATRASSGGADAKALELAWLVCSQAIRKNPKFAPIHNTRGLVAIALGDMGGAAQAFDTARSLAPALFEAHMNFAAVNMQFRGFARAKDAYRAAVRLRPADYDARLGLALALRAEIDAPGAPVVNEALRELGEAKRIAPERPEAYFDEAVLTQEYVPGPEGNADGSLHKAKALFGAFVAKASERSGEVGRWKADIERAKERMDDIDRILAFRNQSK